MCGKRYYEWEISGFQITFKWNYCECYKLQKFLSSVKFLSSLVFRKLPRFFVSDSQLQADNNWTNVAYFSFQLTGTKFTFFTSSHGKDFQILIFLIFFYLCTVHIVTFTLLKDQFMHLFRHFYIHIKTPERLFKMFHKSVIYK
jgi:hypothetical protein